MQSVDREKMAQIYEGFSFAPGFEGGSHDGQEIENTGAQYTDRIKGMLRLLSQYQADLSTELYQDPTTDKLKSLVKLFELLKPAMEHVNPIFKPDRAEPLEGPFHQD